MALDAEFDSAAADWVDIAGSDAVYHSPTNGYSVETKISIERGVETVDESGLMARRDVAAVLNSAVNRPVQGDTIDVEGKHWRVLGFVSSDKHVHMLFVDLEGDL